MLDNLREDAEASSYFDDFDDEIPDFLEEEEDEGIIKAPSFTFLRPITSMTPVQRFLLATLLFMAVCLIGSMGLLVAGKIALF
jgi:chromosome condensin MukBEF MukE localization factor